MTETFAIFGARGLLGSRLVGMLAAQGVTARAVTRGDWPERGTHLGHGIYTIGVTGDFRTRAHEAMEAHVGALSRALQDYSFDSFTYLSSARLYRCAQGRTDEAASFTLSPLDTDKLYDISKMAGEALCRAASRQRTHIARMSNAYSAGDTSPNFLPSVLKEAAMTGAVTIRQSAASRKDHVALDDAASAILTIARHGEADVYNLASGHLTTHGDIARMLTALRGWRVTFADGAPDDLQPELDVMRLSKLMDWQPRRLLDDLPALVEAASRLWGRAA